MPFHTVWNLMDYSVSTILSVVFIIVVVVLVVASILVCVLFLTHACLLFVWC